MKRGRELPASIENAPSLMPGLEIYWQAFMDLISSRMIGMGIGPIWWDTIQKYCEVYGLSDLQTEAMHHHIKALDQVYMEHHSKKK